MATRYNIATEQGVPPTLVALAPATQPIKGGVFNGGFELAPPFVAVQTSSGWIDGTSDGDTAIDQYGWYMVRGATAVAASFDSTVSHSGKYSLKLSTTDATGTLYAINRDAYTLPSFSKYCIPLKVSTKYRFNVWVKTNNAAASAVFATLVTADASLNLISTNTSKLSGTNDWTLLSVEYTTLNDEVYGQITLWNYVAGNVSDAWFDDITLEEIVEDTAFTSTIPTPVRPTIVGVTTTDNIDRSQITSYANSQGIAGDSAGVDYKTANSFVPTREKHAGVVVWKKATVGTPTGNLIFKVVNDNGGVPGTTIYASYSYAPATWNAFSTGEVTVPLPCILTPGTKYWYQGESSVADEANNNYYLWGGNNAGGTATEHYSYYSAAAWHDTPAEAWYWKTLYAKPTENATVVCNGEKISLSADQDGLLSGAIIDLDKGKYLYKGGTAITNVDKISDVYSASAGGGVAAPDGVNGWYIQAGSSLLTFAAGDGAAVAGAININWKINTLLPVKHLKIAFSIYQGEAVDKTLQVSPDNINWTTIHTWNNATDAYYPIVAETDVVNGLTTFYLRYYKGAVSDYVYVRLLSIEADLNTSTVPSIVLQPLATPVQYSENVQLSAVADRVYLRYGKYSNNRGVVVPHLEFCTTATPIKAIPLKVDNSGETNPSIKVIAAETNTCTVGTGTDEGGNFILNDGEYVTITTPATSIKVTYQVGKGTTAFTHLTMNRLYLSSNGVANSATKDPSHQFNFYLGMLKEGVQKALEKLQGAVNDIAKDLINYIPWQNWNPNVTYAGGTGAPTLSTSIYRWKRIGTTVFIQVYMVTSDGNGITGITIPLPVPCAAVTGLYTYIGGYEYVDGVVSQPSVRVSYDTSTAVPSALATWTDTKTCVLGFEGFYEGASP